MRKMYLLLAIVGLVLPYYFFMSFLIVNGLDLQLFFSQLFANNISTFFVVDLVITAIVFWVFLYQQAEVADGKLVGIHLYNVGNWPLLCFAVVSVLS